MGKEFTLKFIFEHFFFLSKSHTNRKKTSDVYHILKVSNKDLKNYKIESSAHDIGTTFPYKLCKHKVLSIINK